jgi:phosphoribosylformylglycinamidine synthase
MKIAIVQFPGSNCERETKLAVRRAGMEPIEFLWNGSREKLRTMDGFVIVGGFSYEDRSRAGIIAALDPVMTEIKAQSVQGKPILGICNGAQILVEAGLVPGLENHKLGMVLTENKRIINGKILGTGYYNDWAYIRLSDHYQRNAFTRHLTPHNRLLIPIAHAEGRFVMTPALWQEISNHGLHVFQYCDETGLILDQFPTNPNGSLHNIAAISNKAGNVMAMMPHPERALAGDPIFQSMRDYLASSRKEHVDPLYYYPRKADIPIYQSSNEGHECIVELMITDHHALTVQNTLNQLGIPVTVKRQVHWEVHCDSALALEQIKQSGVIYNDRKEIATWRSSTEMGERNSLMTFLVRPKEDLLGLKKTQTLKDHFNIQGLNTIYHGILWQFSTKAANIAGLKDQLLQTNIISNPYAHDCYQYNYSNT